MRIAGIAGLTIAIVASVAFEADSLSWGPSHEGLRMGIGLAQASSESVLRIVVENIGPTKRDLLLGGMTGNGPMRNLQFTGTAPDGTECEVLNLADAGPVAGLVLPLIAHLAPGATYEILLPLRKLIYVKDRTDITLETLLAKGYSVRASLEVDAQGAQWAGIPAPWFGKLISGEFRFKK